MNRRLLALLPCAAVALAGATVATAQGTITDAPATFVRGTSPWDTSPDANFTGVSPTLTQDHLFETGWAHRVSGATQETFFPVPTAQNYTGTTSTNDWSGITSAGRTFVAQEVSVVKNTAGPSGFVTMTMKITNNEGTPLDICIFHMMDMDLQPTAGDDRGALLFRNNHIRITDAGTNRAEYRGVGAASYLVRPFGATDIGAVLSNATIDNFNNTGLPFGPGDFTGGFQWCATVPASGGSRSFTAVIAVNNSLVRGDFNDDAQTDLLYRNADNMRHRVWTMDGLTLTATPGELNVTPDQSDTTKRAVCTEDFNGDTRTDILFQDLDDASLEIWVMGGTNGTDRQSVLSVTGGPTLPGTITDWSVAACGDVNRDGEADIQWRNNAATSTDPVNGQKLRTWLMNDNAWVADLIPTPDAAVNSNWAVVAILDFDGDGNNDFLWYNNTSGNIVEWFMDSSWVRIFGQFTTPTNAGNNNWKVSAAGDFGQGKVPSPPPGAGDIVWRNDTSARQVGWIMDGQSTFPFATANTRLEGLFTCPERVSGDCAFGAAPDALNWFIVGPR